MQSALLVIQIIISLLLTLAIIVQVKGTGFGRVWGTGASSFSRRGLERVIFKATFGLSFAFIAVSVLLLFT